MKVLILHQDGMITGSGISLKFMLMGLATSKLEIKVVLAAEGPLRSEIENLGVSVEIVKLRGFWTAPGPKWYRRGAWLNLFSLFQQTELVETVKKFGPHLVHINDKAMLPAGLILRRSGIPIVQHLRSTYYSTNTRLFAWLSRKAIESYATALIGISEDEVSEFPNFPRKFIVNNSMDFDNVEGHLENRDKVRREFFIRDDDRLITYIGQFSRTKGAWDFIEMVSYYVRKYPSDKIKFMMVGHMPEPAKPKPGLRGIVNLGSEESSLILSKMLSKDNLGERIILTGYRRDILDLISASDVMVICNRLGAMGRQAFEAMALGKPLVITQGLSGRSSVVVDGETALVVPPASPEVMAEAVREFLFNPEERKRLSDNAAAYARSNFDYRSNARRIEEIYNSLVNTKAKWSG